MSAAHSEPGVLTVCLLAATRHPDLALRRALLSALEVWVESLEPLHETEAVMNVLRRESGTQLEPFSLEQEHERVAALLVRAAFSRKVDLYRFRMVSQLSLGNQGGLVLTRQLNHFYAERFACGRHAGRFIEPYFAPAGMPRTIDPVSRRGPSSACLVLTDKLVAIDVNAPDAFQHLNAHVSDLELAKASSVGGVPLNSLGLAVERQQGMGWRVSAKTPEAQIRLSAHLVDGSLLRLSTGPSSEFAYDVVVKLRADPADPLPCAIVVKPSFGREWISALELGGPNSDGAKRRPSRMLAWRMRHGSTC
jgi:hypothetical protein